MKLKDYFNNYQIQEKELIGVKNYLDILDYFYILNRLIQKKNDMNFIIRYLPNKLKIRHYLKHIIFENKPDPLIKKIKLIKKVPPLNSIIMCRLRGREIFKLFEECKKYSANKYIIIQQIVGDAGRVDEEILKAIPDNVVRLYTKNREVVHQKVVSIPIGRDYRNKSYHLSLKFDDKNRRFKNLLYCNFSISTNEKNRKPVYDLFKNKDWVTQVKVESYGIYPISQEEYMKQVHSHKFCLSPEGQGMDCYRTWEALYLKSIPIVQNSIHMNSFKDLPILFTRDYSEITRSYLEEKYEEMLETYYNIDKLHFSYWKNLIKKDKNNYELSAPTSLML